MCDENAYCPGDNEKYWCPDGQSDKYFVYGWRLSRFSPQGSTSPTQCYLDNSAYDSWIYEFKYHGFYRWASGKCYYSVEKDIYDCSTAKTFSECNAGYYKNNSIPEGTGFTNSCQPCSPGSYTTATNTVPNTGGPDPSYTYATSCTLCETGTYNDQSAGTSCAACTNKPENAHYVGTGANSANCPWECDAGYYGSSANGDTSCVACGRGNYCPGGSNRTSCADVVPSSSPSPNATYSLSNGSWDDLEHCTTADDCRCDWILEDETRKYYLNQGKCSLGPSGTTFTQYEACRDGYYAAEPLYWGNWYSKCLPCTNAPAHAIYTSYSTPSEMYAVESNCPWECVNGYELNGDALCEKIPLCEAGITTLHIGNGVSIPLYKNSRTTPSLHVGYNNQVCYGSLASGSATGALNVNIGGSVYHAVE